LVGEKNGVLENIEMPQKMDYQPLGVNVRGGGKEETNCKLRKKGEEGKSHTEPQRRSADDGTFVQGRERISLPKPHVEKRDPIPILIRK